jgi:hypothetical protein
MSTTGCAAFTVNSSWMVKPRTKSTCVSLPTSTTAARLATSNADFFDLDEVLTWRQVLKLEEAVVAGLNRPASREQVARDLDGGVGDRCAGLVECGSGNRSGVCGKRRCRNRCQERERDKKRP